MKWNPLLSSLTCVRTVERVFSASVVSARVLSETQCRCYHRVSTLLQPMQKNVQTPLEGQCNESFVSEYLNLVGFVRRSAANGLFHVLPLGQRVLDKIRTEIELHMNGLGGQKISMSSLSPQSLWKKSGRIDSMTREMFQITDRSGQMLFLNPTHEEVVSQLVANMSPISLRQLPLLLYQFSSKYRDEIRPTHGLIRSREFLMKDMYSFDESEEASLKTYFRVVSAYSELFSSLGIDAVKVRSDCGNMGGVMSHEFHVLSPLGSDRLLLCDSCAQCSHCPAAVNATVLHSGGQSDNYSEQCQACGCRLVLRNGIEVGHTFLLGDHYSRVFGAQCRVQSPLSDDGDIMQQPLYMACFGVGVSRLLATVAETVARRAVCLKGRGFRTYWPVNLAPFRLCVIPAKGGSREEAKCNTVLPRLLSDLEAIGCLRDDVIVDDRLQLTIGQRLLTACATGYPFIVVAGRSVSEPVPKLEVMTNGDNWDGSSSLLLEHSETVQYISRQLSSNN